MADLSRRRPETCAIRATTSSAKGILLTKASMDWFEDSYAGPQGDWRYSPLLKGVERPAADLRRHRQP